MIYVCISMCDWILETRIERASQLLARSLESIIKLVLLTWKIITCT